MHKTEIQSMPYPKISEMYSDELIVALILTRLCYRSPVNADTKEEMYRRCLSETGVQSGDKPTYKGIVAEHKALFTPEMYSTNFPSRYWPPLADGGTKLFFQTVGFGSDDLIRELDYSALNDEHYRQLLQGCLNAILGSNHIRFLSRPEIIGIIDKNSPDDGSTPKVTPIQDCTKKELSRACDVSGNFVLNAALECMATNPPMFETTLIRLIESAEEEHILYAVCSLFKDMFGSLPENLQKSILSISSKKIFYFPHTGFGSKKKYNEQVHVILLQILLQNWSSGTLPEEKKQAFLSILTNCGAAVAIRLAKMIKAQPQTLTDGMILGISTTDILLLLAKSSADETRAIAADFWAHKSKKHNPALKKVYKILKKDENPLVRAALKIGYEAAIAQHNASTIHSRKS